MMQLARRASLVVVLLLVSQKWTELLRAFFRDLRFTWPNGVSWHPMRTVSATPTGTGRSQGAPSDHRIPRSPHIRCL
jgi:hypothetical protein